jgi:hypothetical protein
MLPEDLCCHTLLACEMRLHSAPTRVERDVLRCAVSSVRHDDVALMRPVNVAFAAQQTRS